MSWCMRMRMSRLPCPLAGAKGGRRMRLVRIDWLALEIVGFCLVCRGGRQPCVRGRREEGRREGGGGRMGKGGQDRGGLP
jgi:hypothetical protein